MNIFNKKILLVDDEPLILKSLKRELEPWCESNRVEFITFTNAKEALEYLSINHSSVFLVISDLRMPQMKGSALLTEVNKLYPAIKLFLLTAYSDIPDIQIAINASIDKLLLKPWDHHGLKSDIENALKMYKIEKQNRLLKEELQHNITIAGEFQRQLLSNPMLLDESIDVEIKYAPVKQLHCGGDFYNLIDVDDNKKIIMMGDVSGHGIKPAFVTAMLKVLCSMLKPALFKDNISPSKIITDINNGLFKSLGDIKDIIVTFSVIYIDQLNKKIRVSGAGQLPVYILRDDTLIALKDNSIVMGFIHDSEYTEIEYELKKDDLVIMFTDGLIESEKSKSVLDVTRIKQLLLTLNLKENPSETIFDSFQKLQQDTTFTDDVTLITSRIL